MASSASSSDPGGRRPMTRNFGTLRSAPRIEAMRGAHLRVPEFRVIGRLPPGSLDDADEAIRALHGGCVAIPSEHHHFGCVRNRCWSGTPGQRYLSLLVWNQILVERSHDRIGSLRSL